MSDVETTQEYDSGYDAALKDLYNEFNSYGMESAMKMVSFRLHGQGGETVNRVSTEVRELAFELAPELDANERRPIEHSLQSFADAVRDKALEDAAKVCDDCVSLEAYECVQIIRAMKGDA